MHKDLDYKFEVVIPIVPGQPPSNWSTLSPTGLIPVIEDGDYTLADSTAISLYFEKKRPSPSILPDELQLYGRALWFDAYAGGTLFRNVVHPLFHQSVVGPNINKVPTEKTVIDRVLSDKILGYLEFADRWQVSCRAIADAGRHCHCFKLPCLSVLRFQDRSRPISEARAVPAGHHRRGDLQKGAGAGKALRRPDGSGPQFLELIRRARLSLRSRGSRDATPARR